MKSIGITYLIVLLVFSMTLGTFASEYTLYIGDGTVEYQNKLNESAKGKNITFSVIGVDKIWSDSVWQNPDGEIVYAEEGVIASDGSYGLTFRVKESGLYGIISAVDGGNENIEDKFEVILTDKTLEASNKLKNATDVSGIQSVLDTHKYDLGVTSAYISEISENLCLILLNSKGELSDNITEIVSLCKKAVKVAEFNKNKLKSLVGIEDVAGINGTSFEKWYKADFDLDIVKRISGKNYKTVSEYESALQEAILLERIENPDGNKDIVNIVSENYEVMGLSEGTLSLSEAAELAGGDYPTYLSFKNALQKQEKPGTSGGGGGGSSGGGSSSGKSSAGESFSGDSKGNGTENVYFEEDNSVKEKTESRFIDMAGFEWAKNAVEALALKGIVNGKGNGYFAPADLVTREEFAKMIVTLFNFNVVPGEFRFVDVPENSWYYGYVRRAYGSKVVQGISENMFGSGQSVLRQDAFVMVYNALKYNESLPQEGNDKVFEDETEISEYAKDAIKALSSAEIILGDDNGKVSPKAYMTRAEASVILYNIMSIISL